MTISHWLTLSWSILNTQIAESMHVRYAFWQLFYGAACCKIIRLIFDTTLIVRLFLTQNFLNVNLFVLQMFCKHKCFAT